jgi:hypothetical protein
VRRNPRAHGSGAQHRNFIDALKSRLAGMTIVLHRTGTG